MRGPCLPTGRCLSATWSGATRSTVTGSWSASCPSRAAGAPLPAHRGALRRSLPGRLPGARQGDRSLRPQPRRRVLQLRRADHPGRDQALPARPHVVGARAPRPAGAGAARGQARRRAVQRPAAPADGGGDRARRRGHRGAGARGAAGLRGAYRATSLQTPRGTEDEAADTLGDTLACTEPGFGLAEDRATLAQLLRAVTPREREVLRLRFEEELTQRQIGRRIGISQMQTSRIIRHSIARLRTAAHA